MNDGILSEYLGYLKRICGFSIRTLKRHERICTIWQDFLAEKNKKLLEAIPVDFLDFIELRHQQVNNATIAGELCVLNWRDIDLEDGALMVRKGKGGKQRQIFLNDRVRDDLLHYRRQVEGGAYNPVFYAFSQNALGKDKHARLSQSRLVEIIREYSKRAGIEKPVNPLTFRHCFSTHMYEAGVGIAVIKEMLGPDDETETTIYIHISIDAVKRFLKKHIANSS